MNSASSNYLNALNRLQDAIQFPKLGLDSIAQLLKKLGSPEKGMRFLHVAGTNGKGSVSACLESMLRAGGFHTGYFSSPHLSCARERMRIAGKLVSEDDFCWAENEVFEVAQQSGIQCTFFVRTFAMALILFRKHGVRAAVIEVGLGGLYDATNIVWPKVCGITPISFDHMNILGSSLSAIARQKAGIIKAGVPIISAEQQPEAYQTIATQAWQKNAPLTSMGKDISFSVDAENRLSVFKGTQCLLSQASLGLAGSYQFQNAAMAVAMLEEAQLVKSPAIRAQGLAQVKWPGRYELVNHHPHVLMDGAHNPGGLSSLHSALKSDQRFFNKNVIVVLGLTESHASNDLDDIWRKSDLPLKRFIFTQSRNFRALEAHKLPSFFPSFAALSTVIPQASHALRVAVKEAEQSNSLVLVCGSLYLVGDLRLHFVSGPCDPFLPVF